MSCQPADACSVYLHIGEPKTGTTYLQQILWANQKRLRNQGVLLPGKRPVDHWAAAQDLRQVEQEPNDPFGPTAGAWETLAGQARRARRVAIISHELISAVEPEQAARAVDSLRPAEAHVVLTVRDIATLLPAEWQETIKHRNTTAWSEWLADVIDREAPSPDRRRWWFWRVHDTLEILRIWAELVPPERVHVITVPSRPTEPDLLWKRFAQVIGLPPDEVDTRMTLRNASLGMAQVEFLRRLNAALPEHLPDWLYMRSIKDGLAHDALASSMHAAADRLYVPNDREEWARRHADSVMSGLRAAGYHVVGNLDELQPPELPVQRADPATVSDAQLVSAGLAAAVGLTAQVAEMQGVQLDAAEAEWRPPGPLKSKLIELSRRSPALHQLRRAYWQAANTARRIRPRRDRWRAVEDRNLS